MRQTGAQGAIGGLLVSTGILGLVFVHATEAQMLRFTHSEIVQQVQYAAGATDIAVGSGGTVYILYEDLLDTIPRVFSTGLRYAFRRPSGRWVVRTLFSRYNTDAESPQAVASGRTCHFFWSSVVPNRYLGMYWVHVRGDTVLTRRTLLDTTFGGRVSAARFNDYVLVSGYEWHTGVDWGERLFKIRGEEAIEIPFPFAKRWRHVVFAPAGKRGLYIAGRCGESACLAQTNANLSEWQQLGLGTSERAEGLRACAFGDRIFLFWERGRGGAFFTDELRWLVVEPDGSIKGPESLRDVDPPTFLFDPEVVVYRDRYVLLICEQGRFSDRSFSTYYAIYDGQRWTPFRLFEPDSSLVVGNVSGIVDNTGLIRFAYTGGDGSRQVVGYATARVEFPSCVDATGEAVPEVAALVAAYPNPFNGATQIQFSLARSATGTVSIMDVRGRIVRQLSTGPWTAGIHTLRWDGRDDRGEPLPSGVYLVRLDLDGRVAARKVVLVR